ncbi:MAG TPA: response regulator [Polyangiales bacterium]|jgi:CheY-like chemotaxis protein|nr:response regulator [Polyangiales bacterium]
MGDSSGSKKQLGKIMLAQKLVTADELTGMLEEQERRGGKLASTAAREGKITITDALRVLSEQHGVPAVDLRRQVIPLANLQLIPIEIAREHLVLPVKVHGDQLLLAMASPQNETSIEEIQFVTAKTVFPHVSLDEALHEAIDEAYALAERGETHYVGDAVSDEELAAAGITRPDRIKRAAPMPKIPEVMPDVAAGVIAAPDGSAESMAGVIHARPHDTSGPELDQAFSIPPAAPAHSDQELPRKDKKVLVVDDDEEICKLIELALSQVGLPTIEVHSGTEALEMIRTIDPDVIILDAVLPGIHGFDICRRLRGSQRYGEIPIVIVSAIHRGWRVAEDLREAYGIQHVFEKPIDLQRLARTVSSLVEGHELSHDTSALSAEAEAELTHGMKAFESGDIDSAIAHLGTGIAIDPLAFELQYHLGLLHGRREDHFAAIDALETAVGLSPRHFSALKNLAVVYQRAGFRHKAVETWQRAMANAPDDETRGHIKEHMVTLL